MSSGEQRFSVQGIEECSIYRSKNVDQEANERGDRGRPIRQVGVGEVSGGAGLLYHQPNEEGDIRRVYNGNDSSNNASINGESSTASQSNLNISFTSNIGLPSNHYQDQTKSFSRDGASSSWGGDGRGYGKKEETKWRTGTEEGKEQEEKRGAGCNHEFKFCTIIRGFVCKYCGFTTRKTREGDVTPIESVDRWMTTYHENQEDDCMHNFEDDNYTGVTKCIICGYRAPSHVMVKNNGIPILWIPPISNSEYDITELKNEIIEIIMRMSEGDCADSHVYAALSKISQWDDEGKFDRKRVLRNLSDNPDSVDRAIVAFAIYQGMNNNGRRERLDYVAAMSGVNERAIQKAEKIVNEGRVMVNTSPSIKRIIDRLQIDPEWKTAIQYTVEKLINESFCELDILVGGVALAFGDQCKKYKQNKGNTLYHIPMNQIMDEQNWRKNLRGISGAAIKSELKISPSAARRTTKELSDEIVTFIRCYIPSLIKLKERPLVGCVTRLRRKQRK